MIHISINSYLHEDFVYVVCRSIQVEMLNIPGKNLHNCAKDYDYLSTADLIFTGSQLFY